MEILPLQAGLEDAIEHEDDDDLNDDINGLGDDGAGITAHDGFGFSPELDGIRFVFLFNFFDFGGDGGFFFFGSVGGKGQGKEDDLDDDGEDDDSNTHIRGAESLADEPVNTDEDVEEWLVDIGNKGRLHVSLSITPNGRV